MKTNFELDFNNDYDPRYNNYKEIFVRLSKKTFAYLNIEQFYIIEVNLVDKESIQIINKTYRDVDRPTDVISFALLDEFEGEVAVNEDNERPQLLGSIIIAVDVAIEQAKQYNHSERRELKFLYLHGLLHLLGYDHMNKEDEEIMFTLQDEILGKRKELKNVE